MPERVNIIAAMKKRIAVNALQLKMQGLGNFLCNKYVGYKTDKAGPLNFF
jgi:hypothetical protein